MLPGLKKAKSTGQYLLSSESSGLHIHAKSPTAAVFSEGVN